MYSIPHFLVWLSFWIVGSCGFNIDVRTASVFAPPNRSKGNFFGFTVALHSHQNKRWLLVGAPLSDVKAPNGETLARYGALFKCETAGTKECQVVNVDNEPEKTEYFPKGAKEKVAMEVKSGQWLGATLRSRDGRVIVCAPRYNFKRDDVSSYLSINGTQLSLGMTGGCYLLHSDLSKVKPGALLEPCRDQFNDFARLCQAGFSADLTNDGAILSKVGWSWPKNTASRMLQWSGAVEWYSPVTKTFNSSPRTQQESSDYMGYDVAIGHFSQSGSTEIAGGSPRGNDLRGKVMIYKVNDTVVFRSELELPEKNQTGSYFGSTVCAVDLNNDGLSDLLVGAPMYSDVQEEGRVFVYLNKKGALIPMENMVLKGDNLRGGRFGAAIANAGDLNRDGYQDVVIGAPYEGLNSSGAVYVYYGTNKGIESNYRQKIPAEAINSELRGFGSSLAGALDTDNNAYPDVAVGSYTSDHAVLLKTRKIVEIEASITPSRTTIVLENTAFLCEEDDGSQHKCVNVTVCFQFRDREPFNSKDLQIAYHIEADADIRTLDMRRMYFYKENKKTFIVNQRTNISHQGQVFCDPPFTVYISGKYQILDLLKPLTFDLTFSLADESCQSDPEVPCPVLDAYRPTLIRNDELTFQKQCENQICRPDMSVTGKVKLPGDNNVLCVGSSGVLSVVLNIENTEDDASYQSIAILSFPTELSYIGPTSTKQVLCTSSYGNETSKAICYVGNPFKAKSKKIVTIEFAAQDVATSFEITAIITSASNDTNLGNNKLVLPVNVKYLTDVEITGVSQPQEVIYHGKSLVKKNINKQNEIGPLILQTLLIENHGPSFVEDAEVKVDIPQLRTKDDPESLLLYLQSVEISGSGRCNAVTNPLAIPASNTSFWPAKRTGYKQVESSYVQNIDCSTSVCYTFSCSIGFIPSGSSIRIQITARLWQSTFIRQVKQGPTTIVTKARVTVPAKFMQTNTQNDDAKIILTVRPSKAGGVSKEHISWWIYLLAILGGILLLCLAVFIMYKFGFFKRAQSKASSPEETKPMNV